MSKGPVPAPATDPGKPFRQMVSELCAAASLSQLSKAIWASQPGSQGPVSHSLCPPNVYTCCSLPSLEPSAQTSIFDG